MEKSKKTRRVLPGAVRQAMRAGDTQTLSELGHRGASKRAKIAREPFATLVDRIRRRIRQTDTVAGLEQLWLQLQRATHRAQDEVARHARRLESLQQLFDTRIEELDRAARIAQECEDLARERNEHICPVDD